MMALILQHHNGSVCEYGLGTDVMCHCGGQKRDGDHQYYPQVVGGYTPEVAQGYTVRPVATLTVG